MDPDPDPRQALLAKRRALQLRIETERQRAYLADELAALDAHGTPYTIVWPDAVSAQWPGQRAGGGDAAESGGAAGADPWAGPCAGPGDRQQRDRCVREALAARVAGPRTPLLVVWGNAERPALRMAAADVADHCALLLDADWETWIGPTDADWLLECHRDGTVRLLRLPPAGPPPGGR